MNISFTKLHGCGNDYLFVDCLEQPLERAGEIARVLSDRRRGVGSDGLICIYPAATADLRMEMYNADGSRGAMCGNGIRALGKYAYEHGLVASTRLSVDTDSGPRRLELHLTGDLVETVSVEMGRPSFEPAKIPVASQEKAVAIPLKVAGRTWTVTCLSMGNPHCVTFDADPEGLDLEALGPAFACHPFFPQGVNTEFARVDSPELLTMRVWERGSGETMACGTGACAAVVAGALAGDLGRRCTVDLRGGQLVVEYREDGSVRMTGPAVEVCSGSAYVELDESGGAGG
jgi:diaminopimelate epimerase